jgi:hypothetical protein
MQQRRDKTRLPGPLFKPISFVSPRQMEGGDAYNARVALDLLEQHLSVQQRFEKPTTGGSAGRPRVAVTADELKAEFERRRANNEPKSYKVLAQHYGISISAVGRLRRLKK